MKEKIHKVLNNLKYYELAFIRSESNCVEDHEIDIISFDNELRKNFLRESFMRGSLIDKKAINYPHIKLTEFYKEQKFKEIDLVSEIFLFDKSRWFKIVRNIKLLTVVKKDNFNIDITALDIVDKFILLLLHSVADKKNVSFKYYDELKSLRLNIEESILKEKISNYYLNYNFFKSIENSFFSKSKSKSKILKLRKLLFLILIINQQLRFFRGLFNKIKKTFNNFKNKIFDFKVIVFMGADGSGKTTTINDLMSVVGEEKCHYVHLGNKSRILPTTRLINRYRNDNRKKLNKIKVSDINTQRVKINFISKIKSIILNLNLLLDVFINIYWIILKNKFYLKKEFILIDRYIYDKYEVNDSMLKYRLFPAPSLIFLLDASINTLLERKNEHPENTLKYFQNKYYKFLLNQDFSKVIRINSENSLEMNTNLIIRLINSEI